MRVSIHKIDCRSREIEEFLAFPYKIKSSFSVFPYLQFSKDKLLLQNKKLLSTDPHLVLAKDEEQNVVGRILIHQNPEHAADRNREACLKTDSCR